MVQQTSRGLEVEAEVAWGRPGFCGSARRGRDEIAQYRDEAWCTRPQNKTLRHRGSRVGMQISTSVGVVQDILISLSFQKNAKLIMDPSKSQDQPAGICVNCPAAELACRPSRRAEFPSE